ncbi:TIGR02757 family protein [Moheibacter sediminis]|uniref:TIGR02757 family protein n=1 Tax=Moheibacter sediminis TaxID=1434700 RepID=A0A1W2BYY5_9FLAO|nr:TIGR02757 family protein [Moheibacter sediminis]SMC78205.1 TIGR02757 family protein [Moheibacter sediminis]
MNSNELKEFLDEKVIQYNHPNFIESDPIQIPHRFSIKEDIEIAAFFAATMAWGNRKMIINKATDLMNRMGNSPFDFVMNYSENQFDKIETFKHRTINSTDLSFYLKSLQNIYKNHRGLENSFHFKKDETDSFHAIERFRELFLEISHEKRSEKHLSSPANNSAAKRLNMFLRWVVRQDNQGVDFGIWKNISSSQLVCPLDIHSGNVARSLKILTRTQNDWKAVSELNLKLKEFDAEDPVKYDFALFGLGVFENFNRVSPVK